MSQRGFKELALILKQPYCLEFSDCLFTIHAVIGYLSMHMGHANIHLSLKGNSFSLHCTSVLNHIFSMFADITVQLWNVKQF